MVSLSHHHFLSFRFHAMGKVGGSGRDGPFWLVNGNPYDFLAGNCSSPAFHPSETGREQWLLNGHLSFFISWDVSP